MKPSEAHERLCQINQIEKDLFKEREELSRIVRVALQNGEAEFTRDAKVKDLL